VKPRDLLEVNTNIEVKQEHGKKGKTARTVTRIKASNKDFDSAVL
jgi:hypothetical protein